MNTDDTTLNAGSERSAGVARYATSYRLRLSHPLWHRDTFTKWQRGNDFTLALKKARELGVTATVESHNAIAQRTADNNEPKTTP